MSLIRYNNPNIFKFEKPIKLDVPVKDKALITKEIPDTIVATSVKE